MTSLFARRLMAWLLALTVIVGASPVMAASFSGEGPGVSQAGHGQPMAPIQAALDEGYNPAIEDETSRRVADHGGDDAAAIATAELAVGDFGLLRHAQADPQSRIATGVRSSQHKTGPPTA